MGRRDDAMTEYPWLQELKSLEFLDLDPAEDAEGIQGIIGANNEH